MIKHVILVLHVLPSRWQPLVVILIIYTTTPWGEVLKHDYQVREIIPRGDSSPSAYQMS